MRKLQKVTKFKETLKNAGSKATPGRLKVLKLLSKSAKPLSIKDIQGKLKNRKLDQATVYRMMSALEKSGLIRQVDFQHGHAHYELSGNQHHHHLICQSCGKVVDISKCNISSIEKQALKLAKFSTIHHHSLELFGTCSNCAKKTARSKDEAPKK